MLQPEETGVELAVPRPPNAKLGGMPILVGLPEVDQLLDLGVTFLPLGVLWCTKLIHLASYFAARTSFSLASHFSNTS
jgi:hypothetical protein